MPDLTMTSPQVSVDRSSLDRTIDRAVHHLLDLQSPDGYWWAELESNVTITAEHLFFRHVMGIPDPEEAAKAGRYILSQQRDDGTWANWYDGPADLSTTIEAYVALKMSGVSSDAPEMQRARAYILAQGGIERARVFTKIWLAMMGEWPWRGTPMVPPEFMLLPRWFPVNIYSFGCWARQTIAAISIVLTIRPVVPLPESARADELNPHGREGADLRIRNSKSTYLSHCFMMADHALRVADKIPWKPLRRRALHAAETWIVERQEADGSWGGIQPPWVYSLIALRHLGYSLDHPVIQKGISGFYGPTGFSIDDGETFRLQS